MYTRKRKAHVHPKGSRKSPGRGTRVPFLTWEPQAGTFSGTLAAHLLVRVGGGWARRAPTRSDFLHPTAGARTGRAEGEVRVDGPFSPACQRSQRGDRAPESFPGSHPTALPRPRRCEEPQGASAQEGEGGAPGHRACRPAHPRTRLAAGERGSGRRGRTREEPLRSLHCGNRLGVRRGQGQASPVVRYVSSPGRAGGRGAEGEPPGPRCRWRGR